ncbi:hypothetical protein CkaCkLH20_04206 [Colletotrichum karsti]|uniref:Uncharacterized protein n=1 Tax=Colletotrichum karsti TaxID=1095194 RepID=A0A9P6I6G4_9PEZI|nr:uncharacterized protein CkaCkLH20_04206 [Colletotrichum karsti]KAF9878168.1 hypothetical protein CkaCkLH20_04206 [Colletotrichum karsti]
MNFSGFSLSPPRAGATFTPTRTTRSKSADLTDASPKAALAGFSALEVSPNPNNAMTATLDSLNLGGLTTPTKASASGASGLSPIPKSTSKKNAPKFNALSLADDNEDFARPAKSPRTPKTASKKGTGSPRKRVNLSAGVSILSLHRERNSMSPRKTPSPRKLTLVEDASFMSVNGSTPKKACDLSPSKSSPLKSSFRTGKTPSPKKVSFADDASFASACASTPKSPRDFSPKSTPSKPEVTELSIMSTTSPTQSQTSHDLSPAPDANTCEEEDELSLVETPSKTRNAEERQEPSSPVDSPSKMFQSPSKASETSAMFQSPSKLDVSMHDVTWMSDYAPSAPFQEYDFATTKLTETAQMLSGPFRPELFEEADFSSALSAPWSFPMSQIAQKHVRAVNRKKLQRRKRKEVRKMRVEKAIREQVAESLDVNELEAAPQFRIIASRGQLTYAVCSRKRQRVTEEAEDSDALWFEGEEDGIALLIEARRVVRNELYDVPMGPTVQEMRRQYHADMKKFGEPLQSVLGKRNYDSIPKRAYNNDLLTHNIMQPLLSFPMPELSFEFVLSHAIAESDKAQGRRSRRTRNVRQPIAIYGEPEVSVIEEEEEPQSPTRKLPHFPSTATHQSSASRKLRLEQGGDNIRAKLASLASIPEPVSPVDEPLSSPIGPGFTFECPSFISTPSVTKNSDQDETEVVEDAKDDEQETEHFEETVASPIVVFKDRTPGAITPKAAFKKRRSLPAARRLSFSTPLRRTSLPAAGSDQPSLVQDLRDPASESLVAAPTPVVELPAVQNPLEVDSASQADTQASPAPAGGASDAGSSSPASVVVDVRENPDIFGSSQDRTGSPVQALASLARVFEDSIEEEDGKVAVERADGRMVVRFKVSDEHAALFAAEEAASPVSAEADTTEVDDAAQPLSPAVLPASPSPAPAVAMIEEATTETKDDEDVAGDMNDEEDEEIVQVPTVSVTEEVEDDSELALLRSFVSRHAASRAARAAEATATTLAPASPVPTAPIRLAATPERRPQGIWADTPAFSVSSAERPRPSPAVSSARQPLGVLDANSPSPKKIKRKADDVEEKDPSPEKPPSKKTRKTKANKPEKEPKDDKKDEKNDKDERSEADGKDEKSEADEKDESDRPLEADPDPDAPAPRVRTRAQRAAARGEPTPATKIPLRHQGYAKVRNGEKDLATLTRQNTRSNKGSALHVEDMLAQLKDAPEGIETRAAAAARKDGKSVQWAEKLARSQSEEPPLLSPSPELSPAEEKEVGKATRKKAAGTPRKASAQATKSANTTTTKTTKTEAAPKTAAKATKSAAPSKLRQPSTPAAAGGPKTEGAKVTKTTRKVTPAAKKEIGMSVNGTPAPAKRSRRIAEKK